MILGCDRTMIDEVERYRADDVQKASDAVVAAAYECGVGDAIKRAHEARGITEITDDVISRSIMSDWFITDFIVGRHKAQNKPIFTEEVDKLDLGPVEAAIAARKAVVAEVRADRQVRRKADHEAIDQHFMAMLPPLERPEPFERSVVRFSDGRPRPVFHVTPNLEFETFKPMCHFGSAVTVSRHANNSAWRFQEEPVRVIQAYVDIRNPLELPDGGTMSALWILREARKAGILTASELDFVVGVDGAGSGELEMQPEGGHGLLVVEGLLAIVLAAKGYDGIVYANDVEGGGRSWINFRTDQVAIGEIWFNRFDIELGHYVHDPGYSPAPTFI